MANLDPAAEVFGYDPVFDIRDLISVTEVMEELGLGPNGGLMYAMEYLLEHMDWLQDELDSFDDDEYLLLDCPGQLELYTHVPVMRRVIDHLRMWGYDQSTVAIFCVDASFLVDASKFISGSLVSLSAMIALELPHVNVLTKCDLMREEEVERILNYNSASQLWEEQQLHDEERRQSRTIEPSVPSAADVAAASATETSISPPASDSQRQNGLRRYNQRHRLTESICQLLDDWQMVSFVPLNINDEESMDHVLATADHAIQYGEDLEVRGADQNDDYEGNDNGDGDF